MALNPIAFTERVVDDFLHYQLTTYPLADPDLYAQLRALLELEETRKTPLRKGPFVSLSRPFKQGASVAELVADGVFHPQMQAVEAAQIRGERMPAGTTNAAYQERLQQIRETGQAITLLPPEERASRRAMRADDGQPRILLTNVKQLELLLTRGKDVGIFAGAPLEFLVFDEAHTFRGPQGAETACLIRRLRTFCGREPHEVRHIATSATMADPEAGERPAKDFARRFFGVDAGRVTLVREVYDELRWNERRQVPDGPPADTNAVLAALLEAVDAPDVEVADAISAQLVALGGVRLRHDQWQASLASQLSGNEIVYQLARALAKPRALAELPDLLAEKVGRPAPEAEILAWLALGAASGRGGQDPLLRPVVHTFVRGVGGAVVTFSGLGAGARLWLSGEDADAELGEGFRRFPLITCTTCGQHYYETRVKDFALAAEIRGHNT